MQISKQEYVDNFLYLIPFKFLRPGQDGTLYEKALGDYFRYSNIQVKSISPKGITLQDIELEELIIKEDIESYASTWYIKPLSSY